MSTLALDREFAGVSPYVLSLRRQVTEGDAKSITNFSIGSCQSRLMRPAILFGSSFAGKAAEASRCAPPILLASSSVPS